MAGSLILEEDELLTNIGESLAVAPWRREVFPSPNVGLMPLTERRSDHRILWPSGESLSVTLPAGADEPVWLLPSMEQLSQLASLPENWDSYSARTISIHSVARALDLLGTLMTETTPLPSFVPVRNGGIQLEWHTRGVDIELQISSAGLCRGSIDDQRSGTEWTDDVMIDMAPLTEALRRISQL